MRKSYPTNLTDSEWQSLKSHLPTPQKRGRPRIHSSREIMDAIFYVLKSGCQWRLLPCDFPPWETVYHYFRRWSLDGTWERVHHTIRERLRASLGRTPQPSAAIVVDSQSAKTSGVGGEARGYDRAKQVRGILSATSWWTPRVSSSRSRSTAPTSQTRTASGCCLKDPRAIA
jgi:putative transposase